MGVDRFSFTDRITTVQVTIPNGAALSSAVDFGPRLHLLGYQMPSGWDAAALTFQASADGTTFGNLHSTGGTEESHTVAASRYVGVGPGQWHSVRHMKVRSGTAGTPVNQTADRVITLILGED